MKHGTRAQSGAQKIINTCLGLTCDQELLVLFDETTRDVAQMLLEAAYQVSINATAIYIPVSRQEQFDQGTNFPLVMENAIKAADGIVTCLTDVQACLPFRTKIFDVGLNNRVKIGHMPGVTIKVLPMADADYLQMSADCDLLALAMLRGKQLDLTTYNSSGDDYCLKIDIGGWERPPAIGSGLIKRGGWGNIPPGEVFIAPIEGKAQGKVVINGSLPGYVIPSGGEIYLEFECGKLVEFHSKDPRCEAIIKELQDFALQRDDPNWNNLAEIGLGVNPEVEHLTGIELLDEKKYGTAHIALGENDWFGGTVSSTIHSDLIILKPSVSIDGQTMVEKGRIQTSLGDWQEDHRQIEIDAVWRSGFSRLSRSGVRGEQNAGVLKREWMSGRGITQHVQVGISSSARKAGQLYAQIPPFGNQIEMKFLLAQNLDLDEGEIYQLVRLIQMYELLNLT